MGRKERHDLDYFPFFIKDGRTLFILEGKYECKGTGFFTNVCRLFSRTPDHHYQLQNEGDELFFLASVKCDRESAMDMLNIMVTTGKLDRELWEQQKVLASQDFLDSIQEAYRKRSNVCITMEEIKAKYKISTGRNTQASEYLPEEIHLDPPLSGITSAVGAQSKVNKTKEKKRKEISEFILPKDIFPETWNAFIEMRKSIKAPLTEKAKELIIKKLETIGQDKNAVLNQSIENSYRGVFPLKENNNGKKPIEKVYPEVPKEPKVFDHENPDPDKIKAVNNLVDNLSLKLKTPFKRLV